jgi:aminodeoxyfutalosine synthase
MDESHTIIRDPALRALEPKVRARERLSADEILTLLETRDIIGLGALADVPRRGVSGRRAYYCVNHHVNYTNLCVNRCRFCAFSRSPGETGGYDMSLEEVFDRGAEAEAAGATELHVVGGLHPSHPFDWYLEMIRGLAERYPRIHLQAFTAVEIAHLAEISGLDLAGTLEALVEAGLGSLPGGGAEVFSPRVRGEICPEKLPGERWLEVMRAAHELGLRSNATLLYGHVERPSEVVEHLLELRDLQDETGGFMSFIPLAFHPLNTRLQTGRSTTGFADLRTIAAGRLALDNFDHVKAFWIMLGEKLAQVSLAFGADDMDGTVIEEKITHMAGASTPERLARDELVRLITEAGFEPAERDTLYREIARNGAEWRLAAPSSPSKKPEDDVHHHRQHDAQ